MKFTKYQSIVLIHARRMYGSDKLNNLLLDHQLKISTITDMCADGWKNQVPTATTASIVFDYYTSCGS